MSREPYLEENSNIAKVVNKAVDVLAEVALISQGEAFDIIAKLAAKGWVLLEADGKESGFDS